MSRFKTLAAAGVATAALAVFPATAAFAGQTPTPAPSTQPVNPITPHFGFHPPTIQPWQFDVQESAIGNVNVDDVEGTGALVMQAWHDVQLSPVLDRFQLGGNSVTLWHEPLPVPNVNLRTCSVTFDQQDARFVIVAGAGTGAHLRSLNGRFDLLGMVSFPLIRHGRCPLAFVSPFTIRRLIITNHLGFLPKPTFTDFAVQGRADVILPRPVVTPTPAPTGWTPTDNTETATPATSG